MQSPSDKTIRLVILGPEWGLPSISPFGLKLATWMRLAGIDHEIAVENNPGKGPKKKSPWIELDGERMGDSAMIIERLTRERGIDPDSHLDAEGHARGLVIRRLFEAHYMFAFEYSVFVADSGWEHSRKHFDFLPVPVRGLVLRLIRRDFRKGIWTQGIGRHSPEEIDRLACDDLDAAAVLLGDRPFFLGDRPTQTDCTAYAFLALTLWSPVDSAAQRHLRTRENLVAFAERMRDRFWSQEVVARAA